MFSLLIQTLYNDDCSDIEDVHHLFCAHSINIFLFLLGVELRHFFEMPRGPRLCNCVVCGAWSTQWDYDSVVVMVRASHFWFQIDNL